MNMSESKAANALGGKNARACDSCLLKRARWFCTADDAFLCQSCDTSVHSANQLASRHERVRLETSSFKGNNQNKMNSSMPGWHQGFTRKARTPRQPKLKAKLQPPPLPPVVPDINSCEFDILPEENDQEQLLYMVPVLDPFSDEFCTHHEMMFKGEEEDGFDLNLEDLLMSGGDAEFEGDVENIFEMGQDGINIDLDDDQLENLSTDDVLGGKAMKVEEATDNDDDHDEVQAVIACHFDPMLDMELNWDHFDYGSNSSMTIGEKETEESKHDTVQVRVNIESGGIRETEVKKRVLRLNYDAVIAAWDTQGSPWTDGIRPHFYNLDKFTDACFSDPYGGVRGPSGSSDAGREARVSRYREKRRTRLFSKKIRYQVRKLNAEKRPRMKGRFVKRSTMSFQPLTPAYLLNKR